MHDNAVEQRRFRELKIDIILCKIIICKKKMNSGIGMHCYC